MNDPEKTIGGHRFPSRYSDHEKYHGYPHWKKPFTICGLQSLNLNNCRGDRTLYHSQGVDVSDIMYRDREPRYFPVISQS